MCSGGVIGLTAFVSQCLGSNTPLPWRMVVGVARLKIATTMATTTDKQERTRSLVMGAIGYGRVSLTRALSEGSFCWKSRLPESVKPSSQTRADQSSIDRNTRNSAWFVSHGTLRPRLKTVCTSETNVAISGERTS